jgi:hypothetical protein
LSLDYKKYTEPDNDWANDIKDNPIHISQAISGLNGYYCMGCNKVMQAVKMKNPKHQSYFRHHIKDTDTSKIECVHASKEYRERLAYFYFMRTKQIKVPAVYKYPPKGEEGIPVLLQEAKTIVAHRVEREVTFFEDEEGTIHSGKNAKVDERYLWIRPDAVFYDEHDKPILFLEFVVTHKPDIDKLNKLQRLGINTVQIIVPKLPEAELEKSISSVSKVKWTYNEIESNAEYIPVSSGDSEGIPSIDEEQRKLFEESFRCRSAQIGNLIRAIKRCLASQSYRRVEHLFEQEISRIEKTTREHQSRLDEIQTGIESEIHSELGERRGELDGRRDQFQQYKDDLEKRYLKKRWELIEEQKNTDRQLESRHNISEAEREIRARYRRIEDKLRGEYDSNERRYHDEVAEIEFDSEYSRTEEQRIIRAIEEDSDFEKNFFRNSENLRAEFDKLEKEEQFRFERERENIITKHSEYKKDRDQLENSIRSEFERRFEQIAKRIDNRDVQGRDELSERIATILEIRRLLDGYWNRKEYISKFRQGIELVKDGTWKNGS